MRFQPRFNLPITQLLEGPLEGVRFRGGPAGGGGVGGRGGAGAQAAGGQGSGGAGGPLGGMGGLLGNMAKAAPIPGLLPQGGMGGDPLLGGILGGNTMDAFSNTPNAAGSIPSFMGGIAGQGGPGGSPFPDMTGGPGAAITGGGMGDMFDFLKFLNF